MFPRRPRATPPAAHPTASRLDRDRRGVAALEFALVLPVLVIILVGVVDLVQLIRANMKLAHATAALAKIVAQSTQPVYMPNLQLACTAIANMMTPFPTSAMQTGVQSFIWYSTGQVNTSGSNTTTTTPVYYNPTALWASSGCGGPVIAPHLNEDMTARPGDSEIAVTSTYQFTPTFNMVIGPITLTQTAYAKPRDNVPIYQCYSNCVAE